MGYDMRWNSIAQSLYKRVHDHTSVMYIEQHIVIKKTLKTISFDYRRRLEDDAAAQNSKLCNIAEADEDPEETEVEQKDIKKIVII